jgi:non-specific serine/threonine protein kinase/serine/threonine-protein kinase
MMEDELAQRAVELLGRVIDVEPERRAIFLETACGADRALREEIESLLRFHEEAEAAAFLESPAPIPEIASYAPTPNMVGRTIGRYEVRSLIASGGMGHVYLAEQQNPRRAVAMKMMRTGLTSSSALKRFQYESQVLARLQHPNIAQVYEAGMYGGCAEDAADVPWFAMEHVADAVPITEYARSAALGTRQRLELFVRVCDAVHHGHQRGIMHRDLKPSNILIAASGEPKIIDFGIARATDADVALTTMGTDVGRLVGTLQYMSPEQCEADPANLDARSDVYALGVVLYELLCEELPYDVGNRPIFEATRLVREETPPRPSTYDRTLRGDVETITLKALEKERERRYPSAEAFARDIRRYLDSQPIEARSPSVLYQARLFARRNKAVVGAALVVLGALMAVAFTQHRQRLAAERARAEAQMVSSFFTGILESVDPWTMGRDVTMRQKLDEMARDLEKRFRDQPIVEAQLRHSIGRTYAGLSHFDPAGEHLAAAARVRQRELGPLHEDTMSSMRELGETRIHQARWDEAEELFTELVERARRVWGEDHPFLLKASERLAMIATVEGRYADAEPLILDTLEKCRRVLGSEHEVTLDCLGTLGFLYKEQYLNDRAEPVFSELLDLARRLRGAEDLLTVETMTNLGSVFDEQRRYDEAADLLEGAVETSRRVAGEEAVATLTPMAYLARVYKNQKRYAEAESLLVRVVSIRTRATGREHPDTLGAMHELAWLYSLMERYDKAEGLYLEVLELARGTLGADHPYLPAYTGNLGSLYNKQGRYDDAERTYREAVALARRILPDAAYETGMLLKGHGTALRSLGRYETAEAALLESYELLREARGATFAGTRRVAEELVLLYTGWGNPEKADGYRERSEALP